MATKKNEKPTHLKGWTEVINNIDMKGFGLDYPEKTAPKTPTTKKTAPKKADKKVIDNLMTSMLISEAILLQINTDRQKLAGTASSSSHMLTIGEFIAVAPQLFKEFSSISFVYNNNSDVYENYTINLIIGF